MAGKRWPKVEKALAIEERELNELLQQVDESGLRGFSMDHANPKLLHRLKHIASGGLGGYTPFHPEDLIGISPEDEE